MPLAIFKGASYPFRAVRLFFRHPQLLQYLAIPMAVNIILGGILYAISLRWAWRTAGAGYNFIDNLSDGLIAALPQWLQWLDYGFQAIAIVLGGIFIAVIFIFIGLILVQFGTLLGAPWYGQLSEQIEKIRTNRLEVIEIGIVQDLGRAILFELKKIVLTLIVTPLIFALNFIPIAGNIASSIGGTALTLTIICLDFFDAPFERRRLSFRRKLQLVYQAFPASAGFGFICLTLISIPLINLITIPICVASGTLFVCDRLLHKLPSLNSPNEIS